MTDPINGQPSLVRKPYIQINGSAYKTAKGQDVSCGVLAKLGTKIITENGPTLEGNIGFGTENQIYCKISYDTDINKNTEFEIYADGKFLKKMTNKKNNSFELDKIPDKIQDSKEKDGYRKLGAGFLFNFKKEKSTIKLGIETGYRKNFIESNNNNYQNNNNENSPIPLSGKLNPINKNSNVYITPKLNAEWYLDKNKKFSFTADADFFGAEAGFKFNM